MSRTRREEVEVMPIISIDNPENTISLYQDNPAEVFDPSIVDKMVEQIKEQSKRYNYDMSKPADRKACRSMAASIPKLRKFFYEAGRGVVVDLESKVKAITAQRKRLEEACDEAKETIRRPLTEYEDNEKARIAQIDDRIESIKKLCSLMSYVDPFTGGHARSDDVSDVSSEQIKANLEELDVLSTGFDFQEKSEEAKVFIETTRNTLEKELALSLRREEEREKLRKFEEERRLIEEKEAKESQKKARIEAAYNRLHDLALEDIDGCSVKHMTDHVYKIESTIKSVFSDDCNFGEMTAKMFKEKELLDSKQGRLMDELSSLRKMEIEEAEKNAAERALKAEQEAERKRASDKEHKKLIGQQAISDINNIIKDEAAAKAIVTAIYKGEVRNVKLCF